MKQEHYKWWLGGYSADNYWCISKMTNFSQHESGCGTLGTSLSCYLTSSFTPLSPLVSTTCCHGTGFERAQGGWFMLTAGRWCRNRDECASLLLGIIIRRLSALLSLPSAHSSFLLIRLLARRLGRKKQGERRDRLSIKNVSPLDLMQMWTALVADDVWIAFFLVCWVTLIWGWRWHREVFFTYMLIYFVVCENINLCTLFDILLSWKCFFFFCLNTCCQWGAVISNTDQLVSERKITLEWWKITEIQNKLALMQRSCYVTFKNL